MSLDFRSPPVIFAICLGIVYLAFLSGWLLRNHLGIPRSQLKHFGLVLIAAPVGLGVGSLAYALLPWWVVSLLVALLLAACIPWLQAQMKVAELNDPLRGREVRVVRGHPADLQVEIDGEVWNARSEEGLVIFEGERVTVRRRDRFRLVVGRP